MQALIFSEGNGYGHAARDQIISEKFGFRMMTFGKGAEYCRNRRADFIEIPSPYEILTGKGKVNLVSDPADVIKFLNPKALSLINSHFLKVDLVIVDGTPLGLALAALARKKAVYITNDLSATVGIHGVIEKRVAISLQDTLLRSTSAILVPDFPPPMTITMQNLRATPPRPEFIGPLTTRSKQVKHNKKYVVYGNLERKIRPILGDAAVYANRVADIKSYYRDAELVICHGGHTTMMEALSFGKPVLCIVDPSYSERRNNAMTAQALGVGVHLDERLFDENSLKASIAFAGTLDKGRLALYKKMAQELDPMSVFERVISDISWHVRSEVIHRM